MITDEERCSSALLKSLLGWAECWQFHEKLQINQHWINCSHQTASLPYNISNIFFTSSLFNRSRYCIFLSTQCSGVPFDESNKFTACKLAAGGRWAFLKCMSSTHGWDMRFFFARFLEVYKQELIFLFFYEYFYEAALFEMLYLMYCNSSASWYWVHDLLNLIQNEWPCIRVLNPINNHHSNPSKHSFAMLCHLPTKYLPLCYGNL